MNDCFSHNKEENPTIDICLNCTKKKCTGECNKVRSDKQEDKVFVLKQTRTLSNGTVKCSYIRTITNKGDIQSLSSVKNVTPKTYSKVYRLKEKVEKFIRTNILLEIVRKDDEICSGT